MATVTERLDEALRQADDRSRSLRVERIIWLSGHGSLPSVIVGRTETLHLLTAAREVFVNGHFVATLLLAISVINHSLIEVLQLRGEIQNDPGLGPVLAKSEQLKLLPVEWFEPIKRLISRRHPFVHFKEPAHKHALGNRVFHEQKHPTVLIEQDAREAMVLMYDVFRSTLREAA